jgi:hypothetical protein
MGHARGVRLGRSAAGLAAGALAVLATWYVGESVAHACSCAQPPGPRAAAADATAVFEGRTFGVHRESGKVRFTFEVTRVFKGEVGPSVDVYSPAAAATCGRAFEAGVPYLVYAHASPAGVLVDTMCSRTRTSRAAAEDFAELGAGVGPPRTDVTEPTRPSIEPPRIDVTPTPVAPGRRGCSVAGPDDDPAWPSFFSILLPLFVHRRRLPALESEP